MRLAVAVAVACHAPVAQPPIASSTPRPAGAYHPTDPFHVAVAEARARTTIVPAFWACPIDGAMFLCGTEHVLAVHGDRIDTDVALERGHARGIVDEIAGTWPDDAWAISHEPTRPDQYVVERWQSDRWVHVDDIANVFSTSWTVAWHGALFYLRESQPRNVMTIDGAPPMASRIVEDSRCATMPSFAATRDMLVVVGATCGGASTDVTRWTSAGPSVETPVPWPATIGAITTARGPAIVGARSVDGRLAYAPVGLRLAGGRWQSFDPPGDAVFSYAIAPDGTEWAVVDVQGEVVFARESGHPWQRVDGWRAEAQPYAAAMGAGISVTPEKVWVAEGSVWLEVHLDSGCGMDTPPCELRTLLLRTGPRAEPVIFDRVTP